MQNPNQRGPYGRGRDAERTQNPRYGRNDERADETRYGGAYSSADRGYDEQDYEPQSARYRDYADERANYAGYLGSQSGADPERYERDSYYGGAREYGSGSRQYRDEAPARALYSSHSRGGAAYEWRQGQGRQPGNRQNWQSQSGYYRERDEDYGAGRYQEPGRDLSPRYGGDYGREFGRQSAGEYSGSRYAADYDQRDYSNSPYVRPGMTQDAYGRDYSRDYNRSYAHDYGSQERYAGDTGYPSQRGARQGYQGQGYQGHNTPGDYGSQQQGNYQGQSYRGLGPKNYTRSDERIREDLSEKLSNHHYIDASEVNVEVKNGVVTLSGSVEQRHLKHEIEDMAEHCGGVKDVENRLTVSTRSHSGSKSAQQNGPQSGNRNENAGSDTAGKKH